MSARTSVGSSRWSSCTAREVIIAPAPNDELAAHINLDSEHEGGVEVDGAAPGGAVPPRPQRKSYLHGAKHARFG